MDHLDNYEAADKAFNTSSVLTDSNELLLKYLAGLSNQRNVNEGTQHRDVIRGLTINHLLLQRHVDALEKRSSVMQRVVIVLTIITLVATLGQLVAAFYPLVVAAH